MEETNVFIPRKSMFKQDEVCTLTGVKPYVLRFWESEFEEIKPVVSSTGGKLYERDHIEFIIKVKELLFDKKLTIEKVKKELNKREQEQTSFVEHEVNEIKEVKEEILEQSSVRDNVVRGHRDINYEAIDSVREMLSEIVTKTNSIQQSYGWI